MTTRLIFLVGVGVGYVAGARAGRERYEELVRRLRDLAERPEVQEAAGVLRAQVGCMAASRLHRARDGALPR